MRTLQCLYPDGFNLESDTYLFRIHSSHLQLFWPIVDFKVWSWEPDESFLLVKKLDYTDIVFIGFGRFCFRTSFLDNPFSLYTIIIIIRARELLLFVNGFQPLALVIRNSILDLVGLLDPPLFNIIILQIRLQLPVFVQITLTYF